MDEVYLSERTKSKVAIQCCTWTACTCFTLQTIFIAIFAFANPDRNNSFYTADTEVKLHATRELALEASTYDNVIDVHGRFLMWLKWGFWNYAAALMLFFISLLCKPSGILFKAFVCGVACSMCTIILSVQTWTVAGIIFRFTESGRYASGDYLDIEGAFDER